MREPPPAAADRAAPLTADEFAALLGRLGPFERPPRLAVAVSGGPDSMALVRLAQDWAGARGGTVLALIVDHRLRAESTAESASVAAWLHQRGIVGRILAGRGTSRVSGVLAAARTARYGLLEAACRSARHPASAAGPPLRGPGRDRGAAGGRRQRRRWSCRHGGRARGARAAACCGRCWRCPRRAWWPP